MGAGGVGVGWRWGGVAAHSAMRLGNAPNFFLRSPHPSQPAGTTPRVRVSQLEQRQPYPRTTPALPPSLASHSHPHTPH